MSKPGNYYDEDEEFSGFEGAGKPRNPKGLFVVPTGSVSMINVSSSIKGGSVGSTKDTLTLLTTLGTDYDEPWHEAVHYLDKRVSELSINKSKLIESSASFSTRVTENDAKITSTFPAVATSVAGVTGVSISRIEYVGETLAIVVSVTDRSGRASLKTYSITLDG